MRYVRRAVTVARSTVLKFRRVLQLNSRSPSTLLSTRRDQLRGPHNRPMEGSTEKQQGIRFSSKILINFMSKMIKIFDSEKRAALIIESVL